MVNKEKLLEYMWRNSYKPLTAEELIKALSVKQKGPFINLLQELETEGKIVLTRKARYGLPQKMNLLAGRLQGNPKGFAFLIPDDVQEQDVYVKNEDLKGAMHNDRVMVRLFGRKREGQVIRILERANCQVVGTYEHSRYFGFVVPDDRRLGCDIFIPEEEQGGARTHDKVVVEITDWPQQRRNPEGKVLEVLGRKDEPGVDILSIVRKHQLPEAFPEDVLAEAAQIATTVTVADKKGRRDLRHLPLVTIDGADARDLDDAVYLEVLPNGNYALSVHIADVAHYVQAGSLLDQEAFKRGTSVYLVDRVIPMLPPQLSNGICSLNVGEPRLALSCFMEVNAEGDLLKHKLEPSVIQVKKRLTYEQVRSVLEGKVAPKVQEYEPLLQLMGELCLILQRKRRRRGAINFVLPESQVILDQNGKPVKLQQREHSLAEMIIEEFMILTNETISEEFHWREIPFLYRVHEKPDEADLEELNEFLGALGYYVKAGPKGEVQPRVFQQVLEKVKGQAEEKTVNLVMLRSMKHARYAPEAMGHFGLAASYYSHFTAPIRRYADLAIHRLIKQVLSKGFPEKRRKKVAADMGRYAEQVSLRERVAEEAERESLDLKKVEYMQDFLGQTFSGVICGVTSFGFFVELPNTVEGLVHVSTLTDDYYQYVENRLMLIGDFTKKVYRIGDQVKVVLVRVNVTERLLDFEVVL